MDLSVAVGWAASIGLSTSSVAEWTLSSSLGGAGESSVVESSLGGAGESSGVESSLLLKRGDCMCACVCPTFLL